MYILGTIFPPNLSTPGPIGSSTPSAITGTIITATQKFVAANSVLTASDPKISSAQTWNNAGVAFIGHEYKVTDTASLTTSFHSRWLGGVAGTTVLGSLDPIGRFTVASTLASSSGVVRCQANGASGFTIGVSNDTNLSRISAGLWGAGTGAAGSFAGSLKLTDIDIQGALKHFGSTIGFYGVTPVARSASYTITNSLVDRAYDADATTLDEIADVLGTLIADLKLTGIVG